MFTWCFWEASAFCNSSAGLCLTLEKSSGNQPCARQRHAPVPPALSNTCSGMSVLPVACCLNLLLKHRNHQTCRLRAHVHKEPRACLVCTWVAPVQPFPHRSWKQQSNARPKLTSPTVWTHTYMLLESHCYSKQCPIPILDLMDL